MEPARRFDTFHNYLGELALLERCSTLRSRKVIRAGGRIVENAPEHRQSGRTALSLAIIFPQ